MRWVNRKGMLHIGEPFCERAFALGSGVAQAQQPLRLVLARMQRTGKQVGLIETAFLQPLSGQGHGENRIAVAEVVCDRFVLPHQAGQMSGQFRGFAEFEVGHQTIPGESVIHGCGAVAQGWGMPQAGAATQKARGHAERRQRHSAGMTARARDDKTLTAGLANHLSGPILADAAATGEHACQYTRRTLNASVSMTDLSDTGHQAPPTLDAQAARRWAQRAPLQTPWLHAEVAQRMAQRLDWIKLQPQQWLHWDVLRSGMDEHEGLARRYPQAVAWCPVPQLGDGRVEAAYQQALEGRLHSPWWSLRRWFGHATRLHWPAEAQMNMLWANMALHNTPQPQALFRQWHALLATDGFVMFSGLGPDTLIELRQLYRDLGWGSPMHELTDMHDYGDMLVQTGFAEPVMDMERITLTFATPERALQELRGLGRNFHIQRPAGLLGRGRTAQLCAAMDRRLRNEAGDIALTFEIIYGHALKPLPRVKVASESAVSLRDMRQMLASGQGHAN